MRRVVVLALLALAVALPTAAWADGIVLTNQYGSVSASTSGITSINSELTSFNGVVAPKGHALGSVSFGTGALISGSLAAGGVFSTTGSYFTVIGKGNYGEPKGTIFSGTFVGPGITLTLTSPPGQKNLTYTLTGTIQGTLWDGRTVTGTTTQKIVRTLDSVSPCYAAVDAPKCPQPPEFRSAIYPLVTTPSPACS